MVRVADSPVTSIRVMIRVFSLIDPVSESTDLQSWCEPLEPLPNLSLIRQWGLGMVVRSLVDLIVKLITAFSSSQDQMIFWDPSHLDHLGSSQIPSTITCINVWWCLGMKSRVEKVIARGSILIFDDDPKPYPNKPYFWPRWPSLRSSNPDFRTHSMLFYGYTSDLGSEQMIDEVRSLDPQLS